MRIDHQHVVGVDEDRRVGVDQRLRAGTGEEYAGGGLFDVEELRVGGSCHGSEPGGAVVAEFQESGAGECALDERSEKVAREWLCACGCAWL
jgi:hypothetical protein